MLALLIQVYLYYSPSSHLFSVDPWSDQREKIHTKAMLCYSEFLRINVKITKGLLPV